MTEAFCIKLPNGAFMPATDHDRELLKKIKMGRAVKLKMTQVRNYEFHKKYFALLNLAYDYWETPDNQVGERSFDQFREDIIILAGFYKQWIRLDGSTRVVAKSISFHSMTEEDFEKLYSKTIDVIVKHVLVNYTDEMLRSVLEQVESFE